MTPIILGLDTAPMLCACAVVPLDKVAISILGAAITNGIIALNHRTDRYVAFS